MTGKKERSDSRLNVARYQVDRLTPAGEAPDSEPDTAGQPTMDQRAQYVEIAIQQAIRRGDFDDLPGAGQPITNLREIYDPDWWIRKKIEREQITGLGPPALTLRTEDAGLDARLDSAASETVVRDILDDFNRRVIEARKQLSGGPPVVTPTRDVAAQLSAWRERRAARHQALEQEKERQAESRVAMSWRKRLRDKRAR
jgi:hypothetical protein